jgi:hypothetical protein
MGFRPWSELTDDEKVAVQDLLVKLEINEDPVKCWWKAHPANPDYPWTAVTAPGG